jgi:hypothetical protein
MDACRGLLGVDTQSVQDLIADGRLAWAFDLGCRGQMQRACVRVWVECILAHRAGKPQPDGRWAEISDAIIGHSLSEYIAASALGIRFNVDRSTVLRWAASGDLNSQLVGHERRVARAALPPFLARRRIGAITE